MFATIKKTKERLSPWTDLSIGSVHVYGLRSVLSSIKQNHINQQLVFHHPQHKTQNHLANLMSAVDPKTDIQI